MKTGLKDYDAWKTRSPDDDYYRHAIDDRERCFLCDAPLPEGHAPWSFWCSGGLSGALCDDCAPDRDIKAKGE